MFKIKKIVLIHIYTAKKRTYCSRPACKIDSHPPGIPKKVRYLHCRVEFLSNHNLKHQKSARACYRMSMLQLIYLICGICRRCRYSVTQHSVSLHVTTDDPVYPHQLFMRKFVSSVSTFGTKTKSRDVFSALANLLRILGKGRHMIG